MMEINGHPLNVEDAGERDRPAVVLLHHGLGSLDAWRKQVPAINEAAFRTVAYDRWGYGKSQARPGIDMPGFAQDLADLERLLDVLELDKVGVVGHSDGGTIALYFAAAHPERVRCLVTVAAHVYVEEKMDAAILNVRDAFEYNARMRAGLRHVHGEKFEQTFHNWFDGWRGCGCGEWDMRHALAAITCPTLVVQGVEDEHATPQHAVDIAAAIPRAELWLLEGAGHMLPQENADQFNQRLLPFFHMNMWDSLVLPNGIPLSFITGNQGSGFSLNGSMNPDEK